MLVIGFFASAHAESADEKITDSLKVHVLSAPQIVMLADQVKARKVVFIYATWCPYCRKALPKVMDIAKERAGQVYAISVNDNDQDVIKYYAKKEAIPAYSLIRLGGTNPYGVEDYLGADRRSGVPHFILIDEKGNVLESDNMHVEDVDKFLGEGILP